MMKINVLQRIVRIMVVVFVGFNFGCSDATRIKYNTDITGVWFFAMDAVPTGNYLERLTINSDSTFSLVQLARGIYSGQNNRDTSSFFMHEGRYQINKDSIAFLSMKQISYDRFTQLRDTIALQRSLFDHCTFSISENRLTIKYRTFPADGPEETLKVFFKSEI